MALQFGALLRNPRADGTGQTAILQLLRVDQEHQYMSGTDEQRAIIDAELYWFGGLLSAPKVYDNGTNFHAPPTLRAAPDTEGTSKPNRDSKRTIRAYVDDDGDWNVTIDPATAKVE